MMNFKDRSKLTQINNLEKKVLISAPTEKVEMTLNTSNAITSGLLIQRLTELYEDPIEASVRETVSNALDAVTQAHSGERPKVMITPPTSLNPILIIKDNGVGMTYEDLKEVYSKYGASTKMDNLDQIGAYGLGAKSPLAYGTEFTVTSVKDRQKTTIIVAREEMTNYIKIVNSIETDEPSGTTVSIPVSNSDIPRFEENVMKYKETPIDKDVDLYINDEKVETKGYSLITSEALIYRGKEKVYGRIWVKNSKIVDLITNLSEEKISNIIRYIIGGWAYATPSGRNRYYPGSKDMVVELKAGIVGFNSSRDAILDNDRYVDLEELITDYIRSSQFMEDIIETVNGLDISEFKQVTSELLKANKSNATIIDDEIVIDSNKHRNSRYSYSLIPREYSLGDFVHEETGFSLNDILKNVPKQTLPTVAIREHKPMYSKSAVNSIMVNKLDYSEFTSYNVSHINEIIDDIMIKGSEGHKLSVLMVNLAISAYNNNKDVKNKLTFVTDIENEDQIKKLKSGRKTIVRMRKKNDDSNSYSSIIVYTKHSKAEIKKMIKDLEASSLDIQIENAETTLKLMKEYRKKTRVVRKKEIKSLSTDLRKFNSKSNIKEYVNINDIDQSKTNLIIVAKHNYIDSNRLSMMHTWYCNENELSPEDFDMYLSYGTHTANDVKLLTEIGDVKRDPASEQAGLSKAYMDKIHDNVAELNAIRNDSINTSEKAFVRLITGIYGHSAVSVSQALENVLEVAYEVAKVADIDLPSFPSETLNDIADYSRHTFPSLGSYSSWRLDDSAIEHLLTVINDDQYELLHDIVTIISDRRIYKDKDGVMTIDYKYRNMNIDLPTAKSAYKENTTSKAYDKFVKLQVEAYIEFIKSLIEKISLVNF